MSISFSGLSSGIDTSSWIESLVALRQAKVTKLEEEKEKIVMSQDVLSSIKNFFASFRSVIEKVTDAKFGIMSMDLFAQNLATSSNVSVLTGSATHEAEEATYNVQVDKLATSTEAASNRNYMTTVIETQTATLGTKLGELGVQSGQIGVNVGGNNFKLSVSEDDTIGIFIDKLRSVGVDANYNERTGVFTANIDANDINDTLTVQSNGKVGTGIVEAFHLSDSVGGYESGNLETSETDTIVTTATGDTKLSALGVNAGAVTIEANGAEYTFNITNNSTIDEFVNAMKGVGIDASFKDGLLRIIDAEITGDSGTNLIKALGLETKTNQNTQGSDGLSYSEVKTASGGDRIGDFISGVNGAVNVYDKNGNLVGSVTVKDNTTFDDLFDDLSQYGITGRIKDGVVSFSSTDGNYVTGGLMDKLGVGVTTTTVTQTSGVGASSGGLVTYDSVTGETTTTYQTTTSTTTSTSTAGSGMSSGGQVVYDSVTGETTTIYQTTTNNTTSTSTIGSGMSGGQVVYDSVTGETTTIYQTTTNNTTSTSTIGSGMSGGQVVYDSVTGETTTIYNTTTSTTTSTKTSGTGATSDTTIDYETVFAEETVTTYETVITTTTLTTVTAGGGSSSIIEAVVEYTTLKPISTTTIVTTIGTVTTTTTTTVTQSAGTRGFMDSIVRVDTSRLTALSSVNTSGDASITTGTYSISTKAELKKLAELTNSGRIGENTTFVLAADIDLGGEEWTPIGISTDYYECKSFDGTFDGNGYVISNFKVKNSNSSAAAGLFGVASGVIKNLGVENFEATVDSSYGLYCGVGGIVGFYYDKYRYSNITGSITNCYAKGSISGSSYDTYAGGLIGAMGRTEYSSEDGSTIIGAYTSSCLISNSYAEVSSSFYQTGGLIGYAYGNKVSDAVYRLKIDNCYAKSTFTKSGAGLVYRASGTEISNSYAEVNISSSNYSGISAGLVGKLSNSKISNSYAKGTLSYTIDAIAYSGLSVTMGGLVGETTSALITGSTADVVINLNDSISSGSNTMNHVVYAGGLVAKATSTTITSSASKGSITTVSGLGGLLYESYIGGLVGNAYSLNISKTSSSGNVTVTESSYKPNSQSMNLSISSGVGYSRYSNLSDIVISGDLSINITNFTNWSTINAGGTVGYLTGTHTITNATTSGDINVVTGFNQYKQGKLSVGGTVGYLYGATTIVSVCTTGTIVSDGYTGGLIGQAYTSGLGIKNSYASGDVTGGQYAGGLIGYLACSSKIDNSYSSGVINSSQNGTTGGLIGDSSYGSYSTKVTNSYVLGESPNLTGIFVGNGSSNTSLSTVFYNPYYTSATPYIGGGLGSVSDAMTSTTTPFTHNFTAQGGSSLKHTDASSEIFEIESVKVNSSTVYTTTTAIDVKTETLKTTATISTTNTEPPLVYTTLTGQFMEQITRIDTVNLTALSEVNMNRNLADGTYAIRTTEDLKLIGKYNDLGFLTGNYTFVLGADLDLMGQSWTPVSFKGTFDGNGYEISNLTINNTTGGNIGLFGTVDGTVKNLGVKNVNITVDSASAFSVGAIAGKATNVQNCYVTGVGAVKATYSSTVLGAKTDVGGLVGTVQNISYSYANINVVGNETARNSSNYYIYVGALAGHVQVTNGPGSVYYCYATGDISLNSIGYGKAGLIGYGTASFDVGSIDISHCYMTSNITIAGNGHASNDGIIADRYLVNVSYSYYKDGDSYQYTGALYTAMQPLSSAPFDFNQKEGIIDVRAEYKVLSSKTITSSGTGPIVTTHIDTKTETITEVRTVPVTKSVAMTSATTFEQIGMTTDGTIKGKTASGKDFTITITSADTVGDIVGVLKDYGINASVRGGRIYINESDDAYLTSISQNVKNALGITKSDSAMLTVVTQTTITTTTTPVESTKPVTTKVQMTGDTMFSQIGLTSDGTFTGVVNGRAFTMTVTSTDTVGDIVNELEDYGFNASVRGGKFYVDGSEGIYLTGISSNLKTALGITSNPGAGTSYTVVTHTQTTTTTTAIESTKPVTTKVQMTGDTKFSQIGLTSDGTFTGVINGRAFTMTVTSTDTVGDIVNELEDYGFNASVRGGKFYVDGSEGIYLTGISSNLKTALGITSNPGAGTSYTVVTHTQTTTTTTAIESTKPVTTKVQMTGDTKFSELGMTSNTETIIGFANGHAFTMTVTSTDTVGDIVNELEDYGFNASVRGGKFYVDGSEGIYLTGISSNLKTALGITSNPGAGTSYTVTTHTTLTTTTTPIETTTPVTTKIQMSDDTLFSQLGMSSDGTIKGVHNGKAFTIAVTGSDSVGDIVDALSQYGITASVRGGKIYINSSDDAYITEFSNGVKSALGLTASTGSTYTVTTIKTYGNTSATKGELKTITVTSAVSRDTALSELGVTTGEFNIWKDGVKYTALISSDETVGSFMDTLAKFGIEASIINNGNTSTIRVIGNGDAYVAKSSSINNASNVVDVLLPSGNNNTTYNYNGQLQTYNTVTTYKTATEDTLLSEFDTPWGDTMLKNSGILSLEIDGESRNVTITEHDTFGSLIEKLENAGAEAALVGGKFYISSANNVSINTAASTSAIVNPNARINLVKSNSLNNFTASDSPVVEYHTIVEEHTGSAASFANLDTKLSLMNISSGTISIYKNGVKATININSDWTFGDLKSAISARFSDVDLSFEEGYLTLTCADKNAEIDFGSTTDTSNLLAITGLKKDASDRSKVQSARALYNANADSVITEAGLFKNGNVTEGTFVIGEQTITIGSDTTIYDVISQINSSETSNATAWWDSINAQLIIKSRSTGAALINIEAGTSNFTDILGLTDSEWNADGSLKSTKLKVDSQKLGTNAEFRINGTAFTSTSNTINSDVSRIKGVTLELKGVSEGSTVTLTVERDRESLANALSDVVDAYNELMTNVDKEIAIGGTLHDQSMLRLLRNRLQSMMTSSSAGAEVFKNLNQVGICTQKATAGNISTDRINALSFDKDKFFEAFKADEKAVKSLLVGSSTNSGIFVQVEDLLENALRSVTGYFDSTANSMKNKENQIERKIVKGNEAIEKYRAKLENKFNAMDMLIGKMQQQYTSFLGV